MVLVTLVLFLVKTKCLLWKRPVVLTSKHTGKYHVESDVTPPLLQAKQHLIITPHCYERHHVWPAGLCVTPAAGQLISNETLQVQLSMWRELLRLSKPFSLRERSTLLTDMKDPRGGWGPHFVATCEPSSHITTLLSCFVCVCVCVCVCICTRVLICCQSTREGVYLHITENECLVIETEMWLMADPSSPWTATQPCMMSSYCHHMTLQIDVFTVPQRALRCSTWGSYKKCFSSSGVAYIWAEWKATIKEKNVK